MEITIAAKVPFAISFLVHWIQFWSFTAQNGEDGRDSNLKNDERLDGIYSKNPQNFNMDSFVVAFESSTN